MQHSSDQRRQFALLAPSAASVPPALRQRDDDGEHYSKLLSKLQQLRGRVYFEDGAVEQWQLKEDGRHCLEADRNSWHLLAMQETTVTGCARLQVFPAASAFYELGVARSAQARCPVWGENLRRSVKAELERARSERLGFIEAGGWAIAPALRSTTEALRIALGSYAVGELLGGCLGLSTATVRHKSASILRRLGASALEWNGKRLPAYYDPAYRCEMEVVKFDSREPNPKFLDMVDQLKAELTAAPVYCALDMESTVSAGLLSLVGAVKIPEPSPVAAW